MITHKELERQVYPHYPDLQKTRWLFPKDTRYELPTLAQLTEAVQKHSVVGLKFPNGSDCDDRALRLMANIKFEFPYWPLGECSGLLLEVEDFGGPAFEPHDRCMCLTKEGLKVIEPSNNAISDPHENFRVYWVRF